MQATPQQIYDYVMRKYGDPRMAAEAVRRMTPMLQQVQQNPFGRLGRPPEARATPMAPIAPTGLRGFAQDVARSLPVTGEITAAADAVGAYNRGDMVGAGMAAAGAIPMAGGIFRKGGFLNMFRGKPKQDELDPRADKNPQGVLPSYQARDELLGSLDRLSRDRPFGAPPDYNAGFSSEQINQLAKTLSRPHGVDPDKPMPAFVPDGRGRLVNSRNMPDADDAVAGLQLGSNVSGKPPSKPKPLAQKAKPQTKADRDKARAKAVEMWRENDGQMPEIKVDDLRDILPNLSDGQLKTLVKRLRKEMEKSESPDVLERMRPVLGSASGILAGPAYV